MFSAWDFHSWIASVGVVLFLGSFITGLALLATVLISRIWDEEHDVAATPQPSRAAKESSTRKAA